MRALIALLALAVWPALLAAQPLNYDIKVEKSTAGGKLKLAVSVQFFPSTTDTSRFTLPASINWTNNLYRCFRNFSVDGGRYVREDSTHVLVISRGDKPVTLHYDVIQNFSGEQVTVETSCGPILLRDYIHVPGDCLFLTPRHYRSYEVTVRWLNIPEGWTFQNSFCSGQTEQRFHLTTLDWQRSTWVAGDFRILQGEVLGKPVAFALRGKWLFEDETLFELIKKTIVTQRSTWDDTDIPFYSVTMIPFVLPQRGHIVGNARTGQCLGFGGHQSFSVYASEDCLLDPLVDLFNHEMTHNWIGGQINTGVPDATASLRWLTEGFTDYYALRNRWLAGFLTTDEFLEELNREFLAAHYSDPNGEVPNLVLERDYFSNERYENVPYRRGCILALYLDTAIRQKTNNSQTLHDFMLDLLDYTHGKHRDLIEHYEFLAETLADYLGAEEAAYLLAENVDAGRRIDPARFRLPEFLRMRADNGVPQLEIVNGREAEFRK